MHEVVLPAQDLSAITRFYGARLGLEVAQAADRVTVRVGWTTLVFERRPVAGALHLAVNIPTGSFAAAKRWIAERAPIMTRDGSDEFAGPAGWHSRSVYFDGPEGQVLELIERQELPHPAPRGVELLCVSEVGIAVADVAAAVDRLEDAGIRAYGEFRTDGFVPVGDAEGMVIVVEPGRTWMPTADRTAELLPVTITADIAAEVQVAPGVLLIPSR